MSLFLSFSFICLILMHKYKNSYSTYVNMLQSNANKDAANYDTNVDKCYSSRGP